MDRKTQLMKIFSVHIRELLTALPMKFDQLQEIRLRAGRPLMLLYDNEERLIGNESGFVTEMSQAYRVSAQEIQETMTFISHYSIYAYEEEIRQGFLTIQGGHRIGLAGKVLSDQKGIRSIRPITFLNVRLAHQVQGCADSLMPWLYENGRPCHTLILSSPGCGKTTMLRDVIRQFSNGCKFGKGRRVGVVDELDACSKVRGMEMMLRSMNPEVLAVDEIGSREDLQAIESVINCGCRLLATAHGDSVEKLELRPALQKMVERKVFERYVILDRRKKIGHVEAILNADRDYLYQNEQMRQMRQSLLMLHGEIRYTGAELPEAISETAGRCGKPFSDFYETLSEQMRQMTGQTLKILWQECAVQYLKQTCLTKEDQKIFLDLGNQMGYLFRKRFIKI